MPLPGRGNPQDLKLSAMSDAVHVNDEDGGKGPTRFLFRVTEASSPTAMSVSTIYHFLVSKGSFGCWIWGGFGGSCRPSSGTQETISEPAVKMYAFVYPAPSLAVHVRLLRGNCCVPQKVYETVRPSYVGFCV